MLRDGPGGSPFTGQVVPGMQTTRARSAGSVWNRGRCVRTLPAGWWVGDRERSKRPEAVRG
jgi:hypothetical protein